MISTIFAVSGLRVSCLLIKNVPFHEKYSHWRDLLINYISGIQMIFSPKVK